jgi:hypothetical protein
LSVSTKIKHDEECKNEAFFLKKLLADEQQLKLFAIRKITILLMPITFTSVSVPVIQQYQAKKGNFTC